VQTFTPQADRSSFPARRFRRLRRDGAEAARAIPLSAVPASHPSSVSGTNPEKLQFFAEQWARLVEKELGGRVELRGPVPAPIEKIKDEYRWQLWYFTASVSRVIAELAKLRTASRGPTNINAVLDVDPAKSGLSGRTRTADGGGRTAEGGGRTAEGGGRGRTGGGRRAEGGFNRNRGSREIYHMITQMDTNRRSGVTTVALFVNI